MSANNSIAILTPFWYLAGNRYLINIAVLIPIGAAIIMANPEIKIVTHSGNQTDA
jgi:hypothetical protein